MKDFGGSWTEKKLNSFIKYVKAYLTILNVYKKKYHWKVICFDGFAGFGEKILQRQNNYFTLFDFIDIDAHNVSKNDFKIYTGAASKILSLPEPYIFDEYYFVDSNNKTALKIAKNIIMKES